MYSLSVADVIMLGASEGDLKVIMQYVFLVFLTKKGITIYIPKFINVRTFQDPKLTVLLDVQHEIRTELSKSGLC
jgi:hypothetical protein